MYRVIGSEVIVNLKKAPLYKTTADRNQAFVDRLTDLKKKIATELP